MMIGWRILKNCGLAGWLVVLMHSHAPTLSVDHLFKHLFVIRSLNVPINRGFLLASVLSAVFTFMLPFIEKVYRQKNNLGPYYDRTSVVNYISSKLIYANYPP